MIAALAGTATVRPSPPPPPYGSTFSVLNGGNPNGAWELFVQDDTPLDNGTNYNGWMLNLTLANPVGYAADNQLLMTNQANAITLGANAVYILTVTNYGPSSSTNAFVSDNLPDNVTFVSVVPTQGSANNSAALLTWNIGTLATNAGAQLTVTVKPNAAGPCVNKAIVNSVTLDPNPDDDAATATVTVLSGAPPQLTNTVVNNNGMFQLTINGQSGQEYIVQASTNLINWMSVYTNPPPFVSPFTFTDSNATTYPDRFYRVVIGP